MEIDPKNDECIVWAIRFFLGREPVNNEEIEFHRSGHVDFNSLRTAFCQTNEFANFFNRANKKYSQYKVPLFLLPTLVDSEEHSKKNPQIFVSPTLSNPTSQLCTHQQFLEPIYKNLCDEICEPVRSHRKQWEFVWILAAMHKAGVLKEGSRALGFGTGKEPIPSVLAKHKVTVVASDAPQEMDIIQGWSSTNQYSQNASDLFLSKIVDKSVFDNYVSWRPIDMNSIPVDLKDFDVCWSACAFEHLGSIKNGLDFFKNSLNVLKPGGVAIHTTEFNMSSNSDTVETSGLSIFRKCDVEKLAEDIFEAGHEMWPINFHPGSDSIDEVIDMPPYSLPHLKLQISKYTCGSIGLVVRKKA